MANIRILANPKPFPGTRKCMIIEKKVKVSLRLYTFLQIEKELSGSGLSYHMRGNKTDDTVKLLCTLLVFVTWILYEQELCRVFMFIFIV